MLGSHKAGCGRLWPLSRCQADPTFGPGFVTSRVPSGGLRRRLNDDRLARVALAACRASAVSAMEVPTSTAATSDATTGSTGSGAEADAPETSLGPAGSATSAASSTYTSSTGPRARAGTACAACRSEGGTPPARALPARVAPRLLLLRLGPRLGGENSAETCASGSPRAISTLPRSTTRAAAPRSSTARTRADSGVAAAPTSSSGPAVASRQVSPQ